MNRLTEYIKDSSWKHVTESTSLTYFKPQVHTSLAPVKQNTLKADAIQHVLSLAKQSKPERNLESSEVQGAFLLS